jgi:hypothetical protein
MSTIINATTTNGVVIQPDNSGSLVLQTNNGTTALTIDTSQRAAFVAGTAAAPAITTSGDTNTGIFFSAADTIDFAEGGTACGQFDSSANFKFNSGYGSVVTAYGCRAWATFTGFTPTILASGNVSSITRGSAGNYTVIFATAMPDANYTTLPQFQPTVSNSGSDSFAINPTTSQVDIRHFEVGVNRDGNYCCVAIFR